MRQKLPYSPSDNSDETSPPLVSDGLGSGVSTASHVLANSARNSSSINHSQSLGKLEAGRALGATDHELSTAVLGKNSVSISSSSNNSISGMNTDASRKLPPSLPSSSQVLSTADTDRGSRIESGSGSKESIAGSVPLSLLEFRRLVAGGLPNPATRYFVVTGRGLAGALRVMQITQVRS